jgi:hypothetical protein
VLLVVVGALLAFTDRPVRRRGEHADEPELQPVP